ncbi:TetR/AcrR family transcriptional regulator [Flavihumibacter petaseus]|nr:TetR/AcrR family transcriptional regulator [Flavihumibacter petaseus]
MIELDQRDRILYKTKELFMQFGIRSVSMDDIASAMGISKKTIYQYFSDKDELVTAIILFKLQESESTCLHDQHEAENAIDEMFRAMDMVEIQLSTMNPVVLFDLKKYHPHAFALLEKHKNDFLFNVIRKNLLWGIEDGLYRPEINVDVLSRFRIESMLISYDPAFYSKHKLTIAELERIVLEHYLFGIVTQSGYKMVLKYQQKRQKT